MCNILTLHMAAIFAPERSPHICQNGEEENFFFSQLNQGMIRWQV
uniref:Uncharacterized protein n=1 Tax=Anguilla anguilla TaxID=7936 RepID=A0A0E9V2W7_ANGAN